MVKMDIDIARMRGRACRALVCMAGIVLAAALLAPAAAYAEDYNLWVGDVQVTSANTSGTCDGGGTWSYNAASNTLTLTNAKITETHTVFTDRPVNIYAEGMSLTISLVGSNSLSGGQYALYDDGGSLTINGGGSLTAEATLYQGIRARGLKIEGCEVYAFGLNTGLHSEGAIEISNGGRVTAVGNSFGIYSNDRISISGSSVDIRSKVDGARGIESAKGGVSISDSAVRIEANNFGIHSSSGDVSVSGGVVTVGSDKSYGICAIGGKVGIAGCALSSSGATHGLYGSEGLDVSSGDGYGIIEPANYKLEEQGCAIYDAVSNQPAKKVVIGIPRTVSVSASAGGTVEGGGTYAKGQTATLTAEPATDYVFVNWTENGEVVSDCRTYSFTVEGNRTLVANFEVGVGGVCGDNLSWRLSDDHKTLTISGTGEMGSFDAAPWSGYKGVIEEVVIGDGVTSIEQYAFDGCENLKTATVPSSVTSIEAYAFKKDSGIGVDILYGGPRADWESKVNRDRSWFVGRKESEPTVHCRCAVQLAVEPAGAGTVSCDGVPYDNYWYVPFTATANEGYGFAKFTKDGGSYVLSDAVGASSASGTFHVSDGTQLVAHFEARPYAVTYRVVGGTWADGTAADREGTVKYGEKPGDVPSGMRPNEGYGNGRWDKDPGATAIAGATTFTYSFEANEYAVKFVDEGGAVLQSGKVRHGQAPKYGGEEPAKAATAEFIYAWSGWTDGKKAYPKGEALPAVTGDATYTATYEATPVQPTPPEPAEKATLTFDLAGGTLDGKTGAVTIEANVGDSVEAPKAPTKEGYAFKCWRSPELHPGDKYTVEGDHEFTAVWVEEGPVAGAHVMYRLYNPWSGEHLYLDDAVERDKCVDVGWDYEGEGWVSLMDGDAPVYRLFNPYEPMGDHHYTADKAEYDACIEAGWVGEEARWYSAGESEGVPVLRAYNPFCYAAGFIGAHHFTADAAEVDSLVALGWVAEGTAWYGVQVPETQSLSAAAL